MTAQAAETWYHAGEPIPLPACDVIQITKPPVRVMVSDVVADWAEPTKARFNHLCKLPEGWDGYKGRPTRWDTAYFAFEMLRGVCKPSTPTPSIVPLPDGGLQIEWHKENVDLEVTVFGPNNVFAWLSKAGGDEQEVELDTDFGPILTWIDELE